MNEGQHSVRRETGARSAARVNQNAESAAERARHNIRASRAQDHRGERLRHAVGRGGCSSGCSLPDGIGRALVAVRCTRPHRLQGRPVVGTCPAIHITSTIPRAGDAYTTAYVAFIMQQAGLRPSDGRLARALEWLRAHQDRQFGSWAAVSMNKRYEPDPMQILFMQDAATAFAVLALLGE
jgi:hypothetical protein